MTTTWTTVEERIVWTATEDPSYQFVTLRPTSVTLTGGGSGLELGETSSTAYRGDRGKTAYDHSQVVTGNPHGTAIGDISGLQTAIDAKAPLASPTFTGTPVAPTPSANDNSTKLATTAYVDANKQPLDSDLTTIAGLTATTDSFIQAKSSAWAARTIAQVKSDLTVPPLTDLYPVWPNTTDGVGVFLDGSSSSVSATVASAGPVTLMRTCTVSAVKISVNAGGGVGALVAIGIYGATADGRPSTLVYDCGTVAASTGGIKTITLAVAQQLPAGLYFVATALAASTSPTIYGFASATSGGVAGFRGTMPDNLTRNGSYWFSTTGGAMSSTPTWTLSTSPGPITANFGFTIASVP